MSWSMKNVSYRMAGSGSWQYLLADEASKRFYADIYPSGRDMGLLEKDRLDLIPSWREADIVEVKNNMVIPTAPIMTEEDLSILKEWFDDIAGVMCRAVKGHLTDFKNLADRMCPDANPEKTKNLLTILICAHTLDSMVFSHLRKTVMGTYVPRGSAGTFYFWGYGFSTGPERIFGFTSYGGYGKAAVHVLRSHGLDRENLKQVLQQRNTLYFLYEKFIDPGLGKKPAADLSRLSKTDQQVLEALMNVRVVDPKNSSLLTIPVFYPETMRNASELYLKASGPIIHDFMKKMDALGKLVKKCSFARCPSADVLCMLFHLAYAYAADELVKEGIVPEFPVKAGGEWGVWVH